MLTERLKCVVEYAVHGSYGKDSMFLIVAYSHPLSFLPSLLDWYQHGSKFLQVNQTNIGSSSQSGHVFKQSLRHNDTIGAKNHLTR